MGGKDRCSVLQPGCKPGICRIYAIRCVKSGTRNESRMCVAMARDNLPRRTSMEIGTRQPRCAAARRTTAFPLQFAVPHSPKPRATPS